jgi:hypothetical protein
VLLANFDMTFLLFEGFLKASLLWLEVEASSWWHPSLKLRRWKHHVQESTFIAINLGLIYLFKKNLLITSWD